MLIFFAFILFGDAARDISAEPLLTPVMAWPAGPSVRRA